MFEIELKARVHDRRAVLERLDSFAEYTGSVEKRDVYYSAPPGCCGRDGAPHPSVRLRRQTVRQDGICTDTSFFTYKRKEVRTGDGAATEVNDERECAVSDPEPIAAFLEGIGFSPSLQKRKIVESYRVATARGTASLELCGVPPLGDFLEVEILSVSDAPDVVTAVQAEVRALLARCGVALEDVEPRYYSELLAEAGADGCGG
ncbi:MAG: class IV adenylate cyclase [Treponemataceae bacterium]|nr:class IV adenylate cyclase [Treponemataceae bacterium]